LGKALFLFAMEEGRYIKNNPVLNPATKTAERQNKGAEVL